jgi:hypothetical protein
LILQEKWRDSSMTVVAQLSMEPPIRFDFAFLRKGALYFAIMMLVVAFSRGPIGCATYAA